MEDIKTKFNQKNIKYGQRAFALANWIETDLAKKGCAYLQIFRYAMKDPIFEHTLLTPENKYRKLASIYKDLQEYGEAKFFEEYTGAGLEALAKVEERLEIKKETEGLDSHHISLEDSRRNGKTNYLGGEWPEEMRDEERSSRPHTPEKPRYNQPKKSRRVKVKQ